MKKISLVIIVFILFSFTAYAQRGCCSWHGGVGGCDSQTGRTICVDNTLSPSCRCYSDNYNSNVIYSSFLAEETSFYSFSNFTSLNKEIFLQKH